MLSAYETPEIRGLYKLSLKNLAGKVRVHRRWAPVQVPDGLDQASALLVSAFGLRTNVDDTQNFIQFDCLSAKDELEKRFSHFADQLLPTVLKSAVQSANTVVFVPSSDRKSVV